jgi:3-deoxy-D-manno-octulosonic-acid transferase
MTHALYTAALAALVAGYAPAALWRRLARGAPLNLRARLALDRREASGGPRGWVHAVSVGEAIAAAPLVEGLARTYPSLPLVMTTVTETGARVVRERFGGLVTHRFFPLDFPGAVRRAFDRIQPAFLICMETELWPNVLREAAARGVPVMIANGRLSDRSFRRYRAVRRLLGPVLEHVRVFAMQSEEDARRMMALGAHPERVVVTGNLKHDAPPDETGAVELWRRLLGLAPGQRVWIAGSTHRGEEAAVLDAHRAARVTWPDLALILAPRHPERVPEVLALAASRGWSAVRRSQLPRSARSPGSTDGGAPPLIVLDTVGELAALYAVADVVFVGGSLVDRGGHNMLEPALRGKPVLFGPHTSNFREAAGLLVEGGGGIVVRDPEALGAELRRLLSEPALRARVGAAAYAAAASRHGAVQATLDLVGRLLPPGGQA